MEEIIKILIYIHAFFGGLGLITGVISILVKKGSSNHKKAGKIFSISMLISSVISMPIAWMPNHENLFLFLISIFTVYLVLSGTRALQFKTKKEASITDKIISGSMLFFSVMMIAIGVYGVIQTSSLNVLYSFFGVFGLYLSIKDFIFYKNTTKTKNAWLVKHIGKIVGAFIASITAFIIAGLGIGSLIAWLLPSVIGTIYIVYWIKKIKPKAIKISTD